MLGLVASFVIVPLVTVVLLHLFKAPAPVAIGFLIVSVCAGAPFAVPGTTIARGDVPYAIGLMVVSVVLSVVLSPLFLSFLLGRLPGTGDLTIDYLTISLILFFSQILPLALALYFHSRRPAAAEHLAHPAELIQNLLVIAVVVCGLVAQYQSVLKFSVWAFLGMLLLVLCGTVVGWVLGGPERVHARCWPSAPRSAIPASP